MRFSQEKVITSERRWEPTLYSIPLYGGALYKKTTPIHEVEIKLNILRYENNFYRLLGCIASGSQKSDSFVPARNLMLSLRAKMFWGKCSLKKPVLKFRSFYKQSRSGYCIYTMISQGIGGVVGRGEGFFRRWRAATFSGTLDDCHTAGYRFFFNFCGVFLEYLTRGSAWAQFLSIYFKKQVYFPKYSRTYKRGKIHNQDWLHGPGTQKTVTQKTMTHFDKTVTHFDKTVINLENSDPIWKTVTQFEKPWPNLKNPDPLEKLWPNLKISDHLKNHGPIWKIATHMKNRDPIWKTVTQF